MTALFVHAKHIAFAGQTNDKQIVASSELYFLLVNKKTPSLSKIVHNAIKWQSKENVQIELEIGRYFGFDSCYNMKCTWLLTKT